jgi:hypothetical protein
MPLSYLYASKTQRRSSVIEFKGETFSFISKPEAGNTADTRFFGTEQGEIRFVVKRPKSAKKGNALVESAYRREQGNWNTLYPDRKAELFIEDGLRLVLPYLPGETARHLSDDPLICLQQVHAVALAVWDLTKLGLYWWDFHPDNVLIDNQQDGTCKAYLIDLDRVFRIPSNNVWPVLNSLSAETILTAKNKGYECSALRNNYHNFDIFLEDLSTNINKLSDLRSGHKECALHV